MKSSDGFNDRTKRLDERNQEILVEIVDLLGRKWHPVILYQLSNEEELGFSDLHARVSGITNKMLSDGLDTLEDAELIDRRIVETRPVRVRYSLTERGEAITHVVEAMLRWGRQYLDGGNATRGPTAADGGDGAGTEPGEGGRI